MASVPEIKSKIDYSFDESPSLRKDVPTIDNMVKEITDFRIKFGNPSGFVRKYMNEFAGFAAADFVHNLDKRAMDRTQTLEDTRELIREALESEGNKKNWKDKKKEDKETWNNYDALKHLSDLHKNVGAQDQKGLITVEQINETHGELLKGIDKKCGQIRKKVACTEWNDQRHYYPAPEKVEGMFRALIDHHNSCMEHLQSDDKSEEYTANIFKCAARLMFVM